MVKNTIINQIHQDFHFLKNREQVLGIFLYGSYAKDYQTETSDIDICIIVPYQELSKQYEFIMTNLENNIDKYDIRFFEEMGLELQGEILDNGILIFSRNDKIGSVPYGSGPTS